MRVTVLGKSPAWQDAGGACSSYLVEHEGESLLVDCGNGAFAKLKQRFDHRGLGAAVITHMHADHFLDLYTYAYGLTLPGREGPDAERHRPLLWLPPGGAEVADAVSSQWGSAGLLASAFEISEYDPGAGLETGPFSLAFCAVPHYAPTWAIDVRLAGAGERPRVVFGADCGPNEGLAELARGAEVLLLEATLAESDPSDPAPGHMSAREAGELAAKAGAGTLVLTHFSDELDPARVAAEGEAGFGAAPVLAHEGLVITAGD